MKYFAGDIVFTRGDKWYSKLIRWGTRHTGEESTWTNHTGVGENRKSFVEALWRVVETPWRSLDGEFEVWRNMNLTESQRRDISAKARDYLGRKYGWWKIGLQAVDGILGKVFCTDIMCARRLGCMDRYPICSWVVAFTYKSAIGYGFGVPPEVATPDEIRDWCVKRKEWVKL
jgi:hypothetical protein